MFYRIIPIWEPNPCVTIRIRKSNPIIYFGTQVEIEKKWEDA